MVSLFLFRRRTGCRGSASGQYLKVGVGLTGPPIAPRMTAFADFAAERASSVRGVPCASMEHCLRGTD